LPKKKKIDEMKVTRRVLLFVCLLLPATISFADSNDLAKQIDPFIGTGGHGHTFPGPTMPFGMVQLSPDTRLTGWDGCSGYHFSDTVVYGFSHTHLSGTGVSDYGDILLMPITGQPQWDNGYPDQTDAGYASRFEKAEEHASAGYYRTRLADYDIDVELTVTQRTGLHRYVFPVDQPAHVIIDLEHRDRLLGSGLQIIDDRTIAGWRQSSAWARDQLVYFRAVFSRPFTSSQLAPDGSSTPTKALLSFGSEGGPVLAQVAISAVDPAGAEKNLAAEWVDFDFEKTKIQAERAWTEALAPYNISSSAGDDKTIMATAIYHSYIAPNVFSDVDGRYRGLDLSIHTAKNRQQYTVFSLWDTYRATHPLYTLMQRERTQDFIATALSHYKHSGRLPVWELAGNETDCMIGYHSVSFIADAWLKGIRGFDSAFALEAMLASANGDIFGLDSYQKNGFIAIEDEPESVSKTLEYAYDDVCIARFADSLGENEIATEFSRRAQSWRHLFDPDSRCFRPRKNGQWLTPYDPRQVDFHHTEANGWQYRFSAPQHVADHMALFGGDKPFTAVLDSLFTADSATTGREQVDITGRIGQYAHGNEPSHHIAWLYHFSGQPQRTADRVSQILSDFYTSEPDGLIGNEDCGQMSSWYVLAAYGLYDVAPTSQQWLIVPPRYDHMSLKFEDGSVFTTRKIGQGSVQKVTFNGKVLARSWLTHDEVIGGGELLFELGVAGEWGQDVAHRPGTPALTAPITTAPWAIASSDRFRGELEVSLAAADESAEIWYTTADGDVGAGQLYEGPFTLDASADVRFYSVMNEKHSPVVTASFTAINHHWQVQTGTEPNAQYTAGGADALIDGHRGPDNWRTGGWQGYEGQNFTATLELDGPTAITQAGATFLQDMRSWIMMPLELVVEVSIDGKTFVEAGRISHQVPDDVEGIFRQDMLVPWDGPPVVALRYHAISYGSLHAWHLGAGGKSFIFVSELVAE
jgi:predicted alpha-1,2-mannosidase